MKDPSAKKERMEDIPLDIKAEMALREAVADAIAEHKLRGHPIIVWREGKVVTVPPEEIGKGISGVRRKQPVAKKTGT